MMTELLPPGSDRVVDPENFDGGCAGLSSFPIAESKCGSVGVEVATLIKEPGTDGIQDPRALRSIILHFNQSFYLGLPCRRQ
jgi:hypothetical protein